MKYKVQVLNYDSKWVTYCDALTDFYAEIAKADLEAHRFEDYQIRIVKS